RNEIIWHYYNGATSSNKFFGRKHDLILFYVKNEKTLFKNIIREPYEKTSGWVKYNSSNPIKYGKPNPDGKRVHDVWRIPTINNMSKERTGYPTQKPLALLERIIKASSNKHDLVLDPFCGCATTCIAAEKLNRQWIGIDVSVKAYELVKARLNKEIKGEDQNGQRDLLNYEKEVHYTTTPPKRSDINQEDTLLKKYVYIISNPKYKGLYKVGIAKDYKARLNSYQTSDPYRSYKLEYKIYTPWFRELEKHIHTTFENMFEWVNADLKEIIKELENFRK
ncbi:MAG: DNA methyltransferase, partial [Halobacteriovoraceae bacterium]|nr:DNA methyltransferase [Halobacteriovoraceae bacterium]